MGTYTSEVAHRDRQRVLERVRQYIDGGQIIPFGPPEFRGVVGDFGYTFEGEDDLLHLIVERLDGQPLTPDEGRRVAAFVLDGVPPAMVWIKPGIHSQHFYLGHELLVASAVFADDQA